MELKLILQIVGACLGVLYILLEFRANIWLWIVGMLMPIVHGVLYFKAGLYADFGMQVYYVAAGLWGLFRWHREREGNKAGIRRTPVAWWLPIIAVTGVIHGVIYLILITFTDSTVPFFDAMTTALCITAMWMLSRKHLEQWLVWLLVDVITTGLYIYKSLYVTAVLYALYSVLAVVGYLKWRREMAGLK